jgi:hypothetical protein
MHDTQGFNPERERFPMRRLIFLVLLASAACTDSGNESIEIPFALKASDETQAPQPGTPCIYSPVTQAGGVYRVDGFVDLDPNVNPSPGYVLALQVENYLDETTISDSNGNPVSGPQRNDFQVTDAIVTYIAEQSYLAPNLPAKAKFLTSGNVQPAGTEGATAVPVQTLSPDAITALQQNLQALEASQNISSPGGDLVLQVYLEGTLGSGEPAISGNLDFPLHVCIDCFGANPVNCNNGLTASPSLHGPCCAPQDFSDICVECGGLDQACCALPDGVALTCAQDSDCEAFGLGLPGTGITGDCVVPTGATTGSCICQGNADCATFYGASSSCVQGVCQPGCGTGLTCTPQSTLPQGDENCAYLNTRAITNECAPITGS